MSYYPNNYLEVQRDRQLEVFYRQMENSNTIMPCCENSNIVEIQKDKLKIKIKKCNECSKESALCFCNNICKETKSSRGQHEYLTCFSGDCKFLGVRCLLCSKLCKIICSSKGDRLCWCCSCEGQGKGFKAWLDDSLRKYVVKCSDITTINEEIMCSLVLRYEGYFTFKTFIERFCNNNKLDLEKIKEILNNDYPGTNFEGLEENIAKHQSTPKRYSSNYLTETDLDNNYFNSSNFSQLRDQINKLNKRLDEEIEMRKDEDERIRAEYENKFTNIEQKIGSNIENIDKKMDNRHDELVTLIKDLGLGNTKNKKNQKIGKNSKKAERPGPYYFRNRK